MRLPSARLLSKLATAIGQPVSLTSSEFELMTILVQF